MQTKTQNFQQIWDRGRIEAVGEVARAFQTIVDGAAKRLRATDQQRAMARQTSTGRCTWCWNQAVSLDARVDADLIGGAQVQIGNVLLDSSIRSYLGKLRDQLVN